MSTVFGRVPVARVAAVAAGRVVLVVAEMLAHLGLQRGLEHRLGQPGQQPARADQLDPLGAGLLHQLLRELLLIASVIGFWHALILSVMSGPSRRPRSACQARPVTPLFGKSPRPARAAGSGGPSGARIRRQARLRTPRRSEEPPYVVRLACPARSS